MQMIQIIYTVLLTVLMPFIFLRLWWRGRRSPLYRARWAERLGFVDPSSNISDPIWFHLVSLGETRAATPLIKAYQQAHPNIPIVITNTTPTGYEATQKAFGSSVSAYFFSYDLPFCWNIFLKRVHPQKVVILETEIWPNLLWILSKQNIPTFIVNARLSPRSFKRYQWIRWWLKELLKSVHIAAQSPLDAERFHKIGASSVQMLGNIKYDVDLPDNRSAVALMKTLIGERPIWVAASTHVGEEALVLEAHKQICLHIPNALLILIPRHPERFKEVAGLCASKGMPCVQRSQKMAVPIECSVFLGDTIGEMMCFLGVSQAAFVGGSLVPIGGHNTLEPALLRLPICVGPHIFNFVAITDALMEEGGLVMVHDLQALQDMMMQWLRDPAIAKEVGNRAFQVIAKNKGAVQRILSIL